MAIPEDDVLDNEHDRGYRDILSIKEQFLHFVEKYVPGALTDGISPENVERVETSYITNEYKYKESDIIYKLKRDKADVYFYVLIELQSRVDYTMPFRLLQYIVALLTDVFKNTDKKVRRRKGFRLPAVVPIVLYNGDANWTAVKRYREYTEDYEKFGDYIVDFCYHLFDLKRTDEATLLSNKKLLDAIFSLDKNRFGRDEQEEIVKRVMGLPPEDVISVFRWLAYIGGNVIAPSKIEEIFNRPVKKGDQDVMKKHHIQELFEELQEDGAKKAKQHIAKKMIAKGKSIDEIVEYTDLTVDDILSLMK